MIKTNQEQKENCKVWCDALESDKYRQVKGHLEKDGGFCCLGVAREIFPDKLVRHSEDELLDQEDFEDTFGYELSQGALAMSNDEGVPFKDIAKTIKEKVGL